MGKKKYYVVWNGLEPGVYASWQDCLLQVKGVKDARYQGYATEEEALRAYRAGGPEAGGRPAAEAGGGGPDAECLVVDAACSGNPGPMEYQGKYLRTGQTVFRFGPAHGTNNIGEFLAIVHALALLEQKGARMPVYSDSATAISWVRQKQCKTKLPRTARTEPLFALVARAEAWLRGHPAHAPVRKWDTARWGEIPADFGRK